MITKTILRVLAILFGLGLFGGSIEIAERLYKSVKHGVTIPDNGHYQGEFPISVNFTYDVADTMMVSHGEFKGKKKNQWNAQQSDQSVYLSYRGEDFSKGVKPTKVAELYDTIYRTDTSIISLISVPHGLSMIFPTTSTLHKEVESEQRNLKVDFIEPVHGYLADNNIQREWGPFESPINLSSNTIAGSTLILASPKTNKQLIVLLIREIYRNLIFLIIIYQLFRCVIRLNKKFNFTENLYKRLKIIGIALVADCIGMFLLDNEIFKWYQYIYLQIDSTLEKHFTIGDLYVSPLHTFHAESLIIGVLIILISMLVKRSSEIEEQWSMMI